MHDHDIRKKIYKVRALNAFHLLQAVTAGRSSGTSAGYYQSKKSIGMGTQSVSRRGSPANHRILSRPSQGAKEMRIIVTGGAGFIGSHIVDAYLAKGHEVFVVDDLSTGSKTNLHKKATLYVIDLVDPALRKVLAEISPDVVSHHAAQMNLRRSVEDPLFDARTNILGLLNVLEACK